MTEPQKLIATRPQLPAAQEQKTPRGHQEELWQCLVGTCILPHDLTLQISALLCVSHQIPLWALQ